MTSATPNRLPVFFLSHGGPNQATEESSTADFFEKLGQHWTDSLGNLPEDVRPKKILVISAHWEGENGVVRVRTKPENQLYYDFYGFPQFMYELKYPSVGDAALGQRVLDLLKENGVPAAAETKRGVDHGVWVPFLRVLPKPHIPIVQMSLAKMPGKSTKEVLEYHYKLGQVLSKLREENVLIVASGTAVHNLRDMRFYSGTNKVAPYVKPFDKLLDKAALAESAQERVRFGVDEIAESKFLPLAHPELDHLLPFQVALGAAGDDKAQAIHKDFLWSLSSSAYAFGDSNDLSGLSLAV
ncbi:hypothetical protein DFQ27_003070 [Actinomortierella ambigua]|uniref:Extradiol ring-cleavage dioxygenase class III enzyme subunit B domain-containing protein n=1 Tax=Actinomortierella ambigua TaxID=1343610 RepID=A0A9P6Q6Y8_9FUNG|nr:hypothetical protein DFQ27_003070 [Actinomortierella ambigua]